MSEPVDRRVPPGFTQLAKELLMGELPPAHQRIVTAFWGRFVARSVFLVFMVWAMGWMSFDDSPSGFARADDTEKKISSAVDPIKEDIAEIKGEQRAMKRQVDSILRLNLESRLRDLQRQLCESTPNTAQRSLIVRNIRETQIQYRSVNNGEPFEMPKCEDL